jgi:hypothetical protein
VPRIGDQRVRFAETKPKTFSIVGVQRGNTLTAFVSETGKGGDILFLKSGTHSSEQLFDQAESDNKAATWALRFVGFFMMAFGLYLTFRPLKTMTERIPCVGTVVEYGLKFVAVTVAALLSIITIAISWLVANPKIGAIILCVGVAVIGLCAFVFKKFTGRGKEEEIAVSDGGDVEKTGRAAETSGSVSESLTQTLDLNKDGKVDSKDAKIALGKVKESEMLDLNKDGKVDSKDAKIALEKVKDSEMLDLNNDGKVDSKDAKILISVAKN